MLRRTLWMASVLVLGACAPDDQPDEPIESEAGVMVQSLRTAPAPGNEQGTMVALDVVATRSDGQAIVCDDADLSLDVEISFDGGTFQPITGDSLTIQCGNTTPHDVALVVDNSGSQEDVLDSTKLGAKSFAQSVISDGGRVSVVRVSTFASTLSDLTNDQMAVDSALDSMFVNKGWTALYDGVRRGNETLGTVLGSSTAGEFQDVDEFCDERPFGIVAFTNGEDNNSAEEELSGPDGDGMDTTVDDLKGLKINSVPTPIHTIGIGKRLDTQLLTDLSNSTGGRHLVANGAGAIPQAYNRITDFHQNKSRVCARTPSNGCGQAVVRVQYTYSPDGAAPFSNSTEYNVNVPCPVAPVAGRVATMVLTLSDPGIPQATASTLVTNALNWVDPRTDGTAPSILFVRDDNHRNEDSGDVTYIRSLADAAGFTTAYEDEPAQGHNIGHYDAYDVVWFTNPGWPMDDASTMQALLDFTASGGGVVLSGDDVSHSMGKAFPTTPLTRLTHVNNGTKTCGKRTDNNQGDKYKVEFSTTTHPLITGLEGTSFLYGNDIDHSTAAGDGEDVVASASLDGDPNCTVSTPVIVGYAPD